MAKKISFFSSGKLLITSEYAVIDGACALALPTKMGQVMTVIYKEDPVIHWIAKDVDGNIWFEEDFEIRDLHPTYQNNEIIIILIHLYFFQIKKNLPLEVAMRN